MAALLGTAYLVQVHYIGKMRQLILANGWELPIDPIRIDTKLVQAKINGCCRGIASFLRGFC